MKNSQHGFIALFSVIIISATLLLVAVTLSFSKFFERFDIFDSGSKEKSAALADACIESARLAIAREDYTVNKTVLVNDIGTDKGACNYQILPGDKIKAWAVESTAYTYYEAVVNSDDTDIPIICFTELENKDGELDSSSCK